MNEVQLPVINLDEYKYNLPEDRIAKYPLSKRSESKLLVYRQRDISHSTFNQITDYIPAGSSLFFNDTRVIPARLHFTKSTGAHIEVFLLEPIAPTNNVAEAMLVKTSCKWKCLVGNFKKWKDDQHLTTSLKIDHKNITLTASISSRGDQIIEFSWDDDFAFVDIVEATGKIPLPPYINREVNAEDLERYQTVYSMHEGAVAAPTAGLHFTPKVLEDLKERNVSLEYLTLHVSAGTFQPIKESNAVNHPMHAEQIVITLHNLDKLLSASNVISVGTTSMRTLESIYWYGVKLLKKNDTTFFINKLLPYEFSKNELPTLNEALKAVRNHLEGLGVSQLWGQTQIFIFPGYEFKVCEGLITNYHLPGSSLILLVAAFIGNDWKKVYDEALNKGYRFLSYGDSSLLFREQA